MKAHKWKTQTAMLIRADAFSRSFVLYSAQNFKWSIHSSDSKWYCAIVCLSVFALELIHSPKLTTRNKSRKNWAQSALDVAAKSFYPFTLTVNMYSFPSVATVSSSTFSSACKRNMHIFIYSAHSSSLIFVLCIFRPTFFAIFCIVITLQMLFILYIT